MPHQTARRSSSRIRSGDAPRVGEKLVPAVKTGRTLFEELNRADQALSEVVSAVPGVGGEKSPSQPQVESVFLESCDITEVDVSFDDIPVELTVADMAMTGPFEEKLSLLLSRGGPETVTELPLVAGWSEPTYVPSSRSANPSPVSLRQASRRSCTDCHHMNKPLTVRQKRFQCLQYMCGPSPVLPELLYTPEPLSERCDWKIAGGTVGDWHKCPTRPPPVYEQHFCGSKYELLEARRRELDRTLWEREAMTNGIPVYLYVRDTPFFEWPAPPGLH
ncbi:hypothetical protein V8D89_001780 [Ganoderma adspersum]